MATFRRYDPDQQLLLPPSLREWLPPDHLVQFISETVDQLDLRPILAGSNPPLYSRTITLGVRVAVFCDTDS